MLWSELFESPEDDLRAQRVAHHWMSLFSQWMEEHNSDTPLGDVHELLFWQALLRDGRRVNLLCLSGWRLGLVAPDISFAIGWMANGGVGDSRGFLLPVIQEGRRHYYVVLMTRSDPRERTDVVWGLNLSSFIHEVTHYFEYKRGYERAQSRRADKPEGRLADRGPEAYYNDPLEYNAHFHQALSSMFTAMAARQAAEVHYGSTDALPWLDSFASFLAKFIDVAGQQKYQLLRYLSEANKRKTIRRLYKLYGLIKQQWPNVPTIQAQAEAYLANWRAADQQASQAASDTADTTAAAMPSAVPA